MIKKALLVFVFLLLSSTPLKALDLLTEVKAGYFYPTGKLFRDIYSGNGIYGLEVTANAWENFYVWLGADYFTNTGHSIGLENPTRIHLVPLTVGLKYFYPIICDIDLYGGLGFQGTFLETIDNSPFVIHNVSKCGAGAILKFGAIVNMDCGLFFDLFTNYSFQTMNFHFTDGDLVTRHSADLSGIAIGVGIGYRFCN